MEAWQATSEYCFFTEPLPYYNAYLAAKEIGDCDMSYFAAKQLLGYGAWITHFQANSCLADNDFLWTELEDVYMTSVASKDYNEQFSSLSFAISLRNNSNSAKLFSLLRSKARKDTLLRLIKMDSLDKMDFSQIPAPYPDEAGIDSLATVFIDLVKKYGFPSERSVGAEWSKAGVSFLQYGSFSLIYERNKQVRSIFDDAFEEGLISAGEYAAVSFEKPFFINPIFMMSGSKKQYVFEFSESERLEINAIRKSIGLPSIEKQIEVRSKIQIVPDTTYFFSWLGDLHYFIDKPPDHAYHVWDE